MKRIVFLIDTQPPPEVQENRARLPNAFRNSGWSVTVADHAELNLAGDQCRVGDQALSAFDLIWPVGLGPRQTFLDRCQLLAQCKVPLINPIAAAIELHGKLVWTDLTPPTYAAADAALLQRHFDAQRSWVVKPAAGSFGEGVAQVSSAEEIARAMASRPGMWTLQEYNPALVHGEHRTLLVGGRILGTYQRRPIDGLRANLAQNATANPAQMTTAENQIVAEVATRLSDRRVGFASIDTSGEYLVEVNVANPGGLDTLEQVYKQSYNNALVRLVDGWLSVQPTARA